MERHPTEVPIVLRLTRSVAVLLIIVVNFAGFGEEGEKQVRSAYGANYERLLALKNKYDPTNLFRMNQNIKPAG